DTAPQANDIAALGQGGKVKAFIAPAADVDYFSVTIPTSAPSGSLTVSILDGFEPGDTCASNKIDTFVTVSTSNNQILATDDDSGPGLCSLVTLNALPPGKYFISVKNSTVSTKTYSYTIQVTTTLAVCGNGVKEPGEQ